MTCITGTADAAHTKLTAAIGHKDPPAVHDGIPGATPVGVRVSRTHPGMFHRERLAAAVVGKGVYHGVTATRRTDIAAIDDRDLLVYKV